VIQKKVYLIQNCGSENSVDNYVLMKDFNWKGKGKGKAILVTGRGGL
jgi:hypothetical protein